MSNKTTAIQNIFSSESLNTSNAYHLQCMIESHQSDTKLNTKINAEFAANSKAMAFAFLVSKVSAQFDFGNEQPLYDLIIDEGIDIGLLITTATFKLSYKDYISLGEVQSGVKMAITGATSIPSVTLLKDSDLSLALSTLALKLLDISETLGLLETIVYPRRELDDGSITDRKVRIEVKVSMSSKLARTCEEANDGLFPSLVPYAQLEKNTSPLYIDKDIKCNVFNSVVTKADNVEAPLYHLNNVNSIPFYIDQSMIDDGCPAPVNMVRSSKKYHKKRAKKILGLYQFIGTNPFYIRHSLDGKFRTYCKSKFVNYQSTDWFKASIDLGEYQVRTPKQVEDALRWSSINIANLMDFDHYEAGILLEADLKAMGLTTISPDKQLYEQRIALTEAYFDRYDLIGDALDYIRSLAIKTKDHKLPVKQLEKAMKDHYALLDWDGLTPVTLRSLCALDATSSFAQIGGIFSGSIIDAENSNIIGEARHDIYTMVWEHMLTNPKLLLKKPLTRSIAKKLVMRTVYGSFAVRRTYLTKGVSLKQFKLNCEALDEALEAVIPGTMRVVSYLRNSLRNGVTQYQWTMPDGAEARAINSTYSTSHKYEKAKARTVCTWNDKGYTETSEVNRYLTGKKNIGLIALMVQSVDSFLVREVTARCKAEGFDLVTIHDSYACQYKYADKLCSIYKDVVSELASVNLLDMFAADFGGKPFKQDSGLREVLEMGIGDSIYHLC